LSTADRALASADPADDLVVDRLPIVRSRDRVPHAGRVPGTAGRFICGEAPAARYCAASLSSRSSHPSPGPAPDAVERSLARADGLALSLRSALERICLPLARAAAVFVRGRTWHSFGFARLDDHARERFGRSGRWVRDLAALGETLSSLPGLATALAGDDGRPPLGRVAALLVGRAATPASLGAWISHARSIPVRDLRAAVRQARASGTVWPAGDSPAGDPPEDPAPAEGPPEDPSPASASSAVTPPEEDDAPDRSIVRLPVPAPVLAAFDEAVDLYRAVEGTRASVTSFIEALVAEASAGGPLLPEAPGIESAGVGAVIPGAPNADPVTGASRPRIPPSGGFAGDPDRVSLRSGLDAAIVESALARSTGCWNHLPASSPASWALALAGTSLARLEGLSRSTGNGSPAELDARIRALILLENELEARLGRLLAEMAERGAWPRLRFAGVGHYAEQRLGLSRTSAEDRARAARALRRFPLLRAAYEEGRLGLELTLLVLRILGDGPADHSTEAAWLARAEEATVKRLRDEARALARRRFNVETGRAGRFGDDGPFGGAGPSGDPGRSESGSPRACAGHHRPLDDAVWHASLRREPGTARRRIIYLGRLAAGWSESPGALPGPDVFLRLRLPDDLAADFVGAIEAARLELSGRADAVPWDAPWPEADPAPSVAAARTFSTRSRRVPAWVGLLALLEDFARTWDPVGDEAAAGRAAPRASGAAAARATPRRPGDAVYIRDGWRCTAPACTSMRNLEDHHIRYRSRGGSDNPSNRTCLCRFHHQRGEHGGLASCTGSAPLGITWRLGSPDLATWYRNERRIEAADRRLAGHET
jgi:hypothetical protein